MSERAQDGDPTVADPAHRRRWLVVARRAYLVALAVVLVWALARSGEEIVAVVRGARPGLLALALLLGLGQLGVNAAFWRATVHSLGERVAWARVLAATAGNLPARYVPGSVWYPLGRAATLHRDGVTKRALGVAAVLEAALGVVVSLSLGGLLLLAGGLVPAGAAPLAVACVGLLAASTPPVVNRGLRLLAARRGGAPARLAWRRWLVLLAWAGAFWVWSATTFTVYLHAFAGLDTGPAVFVAGAFLVAWGVGYLSVFAPQGLGVFEVTAAALLAGQPSAALAVVIGGYRALMAVRDALAFTAAALARRR